MSESSIVDCGKGRSVLVCETSVRGMICWAPRDHVRGKMHVQGGAVAAMAAPQTAQGTRCCDGGGVCARIQARYDQAVVRGSEGVIHWQANEVLRV